MVVALLAEGVGRNWGGGTAAPLSSVALLAEGVGRNVQNGAKIYLVARRPPRGGRG